jgi:acetylornithine deacetylase/succinyl-diaminopimelate desuccinylase-like protein
MSAPSQVATRALPLSDEQRAWVEAARARLDRDWMREILCRLIEIPSPFGEEKPIADALAGIMAACGLKAEVQALDPQSANALGTLTGSPDGPTTLLFVPLDSPFTDRAEDEVPWVGDTLPPHLKAVATVNGDAVNGLSGHNPKGHITAMIAAVKALKEAGVPIRGEVVLGFGAGGAPANPRPGDPRPRVGHCRGAEHMLDQGLKPDFALIAKPGFRVAWEEVGMIWFRIRVRGYQSYVGRKHLLAYKNPIAQAAPVITALEAWFPKYTEAHTDGLVGPQGAVSAIQGGWPYKPAFVPAACDLYVDMRLSPRTSPDQAEAELRAELDRIRLANPGLEMDCERLVALPGGTTDPDNWIIQTFLRAWEDVEGKPHEPYLVTSGQTDSVILRARGIPTARIGLEQHMGPVDPETQGKARHSMGAVTLDMIEDYARLLIYALVDTQTRSRKDVGL